MSPVFLWKFILSFLDTLKQSILEIERNIWHQLLSPGWTKKRFWMVKCVLYSYLACVAGFPQFPTTVTTTAAYKGWVATQHNVKDDSKAPQVTTLVVNGGFFTEGLNHLGCHVLCRATLRQRGSKNKFVSPRDDKRKTYLEI